MSPRAEAAKPTRRRAAEDDGFGQSPVYPTHIAIVDDDHVRALPAELGELSEAIMVLDHLVDQLAGRLDQLLDPTPSDVAEDMAAATVASAVSPITDRVRHSRHQVNLIADRVRSLAERVEV